VAIVSDGSTVTSQPRLDRGGGGRLVSELGTPSVLVNNAGVDQPPDSGGSRSAIGDLPIEQFRRMVE